MSIYYKELEEKRQELHEAQALAEMSSSSGGWQVVVAMVEKKRRVAYEKWCGLEDAPLEAMVKHEPKVLTRLMDEIMEKIQNREILKEEIVSLEKDIARDQEEPKQSVNEEIQRLTDNNVTDEKSFADYFRERAPQLSKALGLGVPRGTQSEKVIK